MRRPPARANYLQIANVKGFLDRHPGPRYTEWQGQGGTLVCQAADPQPTGAAAGGVFSPSGRQLQRCSVAGLDRFLQAGQEIEQPGVELLGLLLLDVVPAVGDHLQAGLSSGQLRRQGRGLGISGAYAAPPRGEDE